jgi:hypothetical protein
MRMNARLGRAALCLLAISCAIAAYAQDDTLRPALENRYAAMKAAMAAKDQHAISSLLAPDFVSVDIAGHTENASQMIKDVVDLPADPNQISETTLLDIKNDANRVFVDQRYDMKTKKDAPEGPAHEVELTTLSSDTWVNSKGIWLLQRTETKQMDYSVDGKVVVHKVRK